MTSKEIRKQLRKDMGIEPDEQGEEQVKEYGVWKVNYAGLWMGGVAFVIASRAGEAINLVKEDGGTCNFDRVKAEVAALLYGEQEPQVIWNWNGDY